MCGMVEDGFNTIRIPWNDLLITENPPPYPKYSAVLDFKTNGLQFADEVCLKSAASIAMATSRGVKDVLSGPISLRRRHKLKDTHLFNLRRGSTQ